MKLIFKKVPKWTKKHMDFFIKNGQSYGQTLSEVFYNEELINISKGNPRLRCSPSNLCYEIFENEMYLGDIIIDEDNEIDILIFDEYSGNNYAYKAIELFLKEHYSDGVSFQAVVRSKNKNKDKVEHILKKLGFYNVDISSEGNYIWQY